MREEDSTTVSEIDPLAGTGQFKERKGMEQEKDTSNAVGPDIAEKLTGIIQTMSDAMSGIKAQFEGLHAKIDRIVAAVEEDELGAGKEKESLQKKLAEAEKTNANIRAQAEHVQRKTLSPVVSRLLAKEGVEGEAAIETSLLEKALAGLSVEQRIAVKAELARAGILM
jgi:hypothetical protein